MTQTRGVSSTGGPEPRFAIPVSSDDNLGPHLVLRTPMPTRHTLFSIAVLPRFASEVTAQGPTLAAAQTALRGCTYETCALRLSTRVFRGVAVNRGLNGPLENFGFAGGSLRRAVSAVPAALVEAEIGHCRYVRGGTYSVVGGVASTALTMFALRETCSPNTTRALWIGSAAMVGVSVYGGTQIARGAESFSRDLALQHGDPAMTCTEAFA